MARGQMSGGGSQVRSRRRSAERWVQNAECETSNEQEAKGED
jgi:hypothetical protein